MNREIFAKRPQQNHVFVKTFEPQRHRGHGGRGRTPSPCPLCLCGLSLRQARSLGKRSPKNSFFTCFTIERPQQNHVFIETFEPQRHRGHGGRGLTPSPCLLCLCGLSLRHARSLGKRPPKNSFFTRFTIERPQQNHVFVETFEPQRHRGHRGRGRTPSPCLLCLCGFISSARAITQQEALKEQLLYSFYTGSSKVFWGLCKQTAVRSPVHQRLI